MKQPHIISIEQLAGFEPEITVASGPGINGHKRLNAVVDVLESKMVFRVCFGEGKQEGGTAEFYTIKEAVDFYNEK